MSSMSLQLLREWQLEPEARHSALTLELVAHHRGCLASDSDRGCGYDPCAWISIYCASSVDRGCGCGCGAVDRGCGYGCGAGDRDRGCGYGYCVAVYVDCGCGCGCGAASQPDSPHLHGHGTARPPSSAPADACWSTAAARCATWLGPWHTAFICRLILWCSCAPHVLDTYLQAPVATAEARQDLMGACWFKCDAARRTQTDSDDAHCRDLPLVDKPTPAGHPAHTHNHRESEGVTSQVES